MIIEFINAVLTLLVSISQIQAKIVSRSFATPLAQSCMMIILSLSQSNFLYLPGHTGIPNSWRAPESREVSDCIHSTNILYAVFLPFLH